MRFKVQLAHEVQRFFQTCSKEERAVFRELIVQLGSDPVRLSNPCSDPTISRYTLRVLNYGGFRVVFGFNRLGTTVKVKQCNRIQGPNDKHDEGRN